MISDNGLNITELYIPEGNSPSVPISFKIAPFGSCEPPVSPLYDWSNSIYGSHVCCKRKSVDTYWSLKIQKQRYSPGFITTVCDDWVVKFFPLQYVMTTMDLFCSIESFDGKVDYIPSFLSKKVKRQICHSCHINESIFNISTRRRGTSLWDDNINKIKKMCVKCLYGHFLFKKLFNTTELRILRRLYPRITGTKKNKPDVSRHYAKDAYGPIEIRKEELDWHRKKMKSNVDYLQRVYGFSDSKQLFGIPVEDEDD